MKWSEIFFDPAAVKETEYDIIYKTLAERFKNSYDMGSKAEIQQEDLENIKRRLHAFSDWADILWKRACGRTLGPRRSS
jgi:hypothetical protein